jgi:hypothetical protein
VIEYGGSFYLLHETDTLTQFLGGKREFGGFSFTPFITRVPVGTVDRTVRSSHGRLIHRFRGGDFTACGKYIGVEGCWADGPVSCRACLKLEAA